MSTKEKTKLPSWFNGELYEDGDTVTNPYSGEECELNKYELSMYDFLMGATMVVEMGVKNPTIIKNIQDGLYWFRVNNSKAYMVLLD